MGLDILVKWIGGRWASPSTNVFTTRWVSPAYNDMAEATSIPDITILTASSDHSKLKRTKH